MKRATFYLVGALSLAHACLWPGRAAAGEARTVIISPSEPSWAEALAAREVRRYIYVRTGALLPITPVGKRLPRNQSAILIGRKDRPFPELTGDVTPSLNRLEPQSYLLKTFESARSGNQRLLLAGGDDAGVLYAAYRFAEGLGVRFYLHGDVIPDEQVKWQMPMLDERSQPLFALRGIQPFHDFPEGPDWWNRDDYLAIIGQLPKLRMNFIGLHTYPEGHPNAEPTVWIGTPKDFAEKGAVTFSYPSSYQSTLRGNWGYAARPTSEFIFGSSTLFERDNYGADVMLGHIPQPITPEGCNEVFNRTATTLREAFTFARQLGVKTCVGTETPLIVPKLVQQRLKAGGADPANLATIQELYAGIFRRAMAAYPLDYYWFWTPEGWTWSGTKDETVKATMNDLLAGIAAHKQVQPPFALATCGWVLGPQQDRAMFDKVLPKDVAVSCINREVGKTPVEPGFADVHGRSKWAIPWMEDDPALSAPQLWVGRMRRDAADALRYGCDGLMGIHWRTRVLSPNIGALAQAAWNQKPWVESYKPPPPRPKEPQKPGPVGGMSAPFPNNTISGTEDQPLYRDVRYDVSGYHLPVSNGVCRVVLKFCEPHYGEPGRRVFDVKLQGQTMITNLDIFGRAGKNKALDFTFENVEVTNGWVRVEFVPRVEFPSIAALAIEGPGSNIRINCGGPAYGEYAADAPDAEPAKQVYAATRDFYEDWARHEFGSDVARSAADIFVKMDCQLPVPSFWKDGPGGIQPDARPWEQVKTNYIFVDEFAALRAEVRGPGALERFDYWDSTFKYLRYMGQLNCAWGEFNRAMEKVKAEKDAAKQKELARNIALPARVNIVTILRSLYETMFATVSTTGELGTVANWNQHNLPELLTKPGDELVKILGQDLPPEAQPGRSYSGPVRVIVPTKRTSLREGEALKLRISILSEQPPRETGFYWRKLGAKKFARVPLEHVGRSVYAVEVPAAGKTDFEYYIKVDGGGGQPVYYPSSAPRINQTVVVCGAPQS